MTSSARARSSAAQASAWNEPCDDAASAVGALGRGAGQRDVLVAGKDRAVIEQRLMRRLERRAGPALLDFSSPEVVRAFRVVNDGVMGGVSTSRLSPAAGAMLFEGHVSLENSGGFASFRGPLELPEQCAALLLTVRGDAQRYKLTLKPDDGPSTPQYQAAFVAPRKWQTLRFEPADFAASFRGRAVAAPIVRFADMRHVGLLISDKQAGAFRIELKDIRAE